MLMRRMKTTMVVERMVLRMIRVAMICLILLPHSLYNNVDAGCMDDAGHGDAHGDGDWRVVFESVVLVSICLSE